MTKAYDLDNLFLIHFFHSFMPSIGILYDLLENLNQFQVNMNWSFYLGIGDS